MKQELRSNRYIVYYVMIILLVVIVVNVFKLLTVTVDDVNVSCGESTMVVVGDITYNEEDNYYVFSNNVLDDIYIHGSSIVEGYDITKLANGSMVSICLDNAQGDYKDNHGSTKYYVAQLTVGTNNWITEESYTTALTQDILDSRMQYQTYAILSALGIAVGGVALIFIIRYDKEHAGEQDNIVAG